MKKTIALVLVLLMTAVSAFADTEIQTVGLGVVTATPDSASLSLGVSVKDADVQTALSLVNERLDSVRAALTAQGVAAEDIALSDIYMYTQYGDDYASMENNTELYVVSHQITVTVRDVDKVGALIDAAAGAGVNQFNSVSFQLADTTATYQQALQLAVKNAREKATLIAEAEGLTLGKIKDMEEQVDGFGSYATAAKATADMGGMGGATSIDVGSTTINATVVVTYDIAD